MTLRQALLNYDKKVKVSDLEIPEVDEKFARFKKMTDLLMEESAFDAIELCNGLNDVIDSFLREESTKRKLDSLPATLLD